KAFSFSLPNRQPCRLNGRIVVRAGGSHDVDIFLVDADGFLNFQNSRDFNAWIREKRTTAYTFDIVINSPGEHYLIISNRFSFGTSKTVQIEEPLSSLCG
ncbi:MAG TPA: hypothetical protein VFQ39_07465, partial [Longimicrobium sp.]|nr:hypothetical protein [Longimicrobium sp.]